MKKVNLNIITEPCIHLLNIKPKDIYENLMNGKYSTLTMDILSMFSMDFNGKSTSKMTIVGKNNISDIFTRTNMYNQIQLYATTNCQFFSDRTDLKCQWCRTEFDGTKYQAVGIPVDIYEDEDGNTIIYVISCNCSFRCALSDLEDELNSGRQIVNSNSKSILYYAFGLAHPGKELTPAPYWRLLKSNGGSIEYKDFIANTYVIKASTVESDKKMYVCPKKNIFEKI